ncbi:MAG: CinA family protein [Parvibaculales bacterium]
MFDAMLIEKAERLLKTCGERHMRVATAESCTGGLIAALLTEIPGSSVVIGRSFITYSNRAKREVLNVPAELLQQHGAVSERVVRAMAQNTFDITTAHLTVAVSGIAGPGGGSAEKPAGTVHMATATADGVTHMCHQFGDIGRTQVRLATVNAAMDMMLGRLA